MVSVLAPFLASLASAASLGFDEQAVEAAGLGQRFERRIAGPVEEGAVGVDQVVEPVDQEADRQAVEDRPAFVGVARGIAIARGFRRLGLAGGAGATKGSTPKSSGVGVPFCPGFFSRALSSRASSWKALCSPGAERRRRLDRRRRRRRKRQHLGRRLASGLRRALAGAPGRPAARRRGRCRSRGSRRIAVRGRTPAGRTSRSARRSLGHRPATARRCRSRCRARPARWRSGLGGSSLSASAISAQVRLSTAAVFGPSSWAKSSVPSVKRVAASICQTKRNGSWRAPGLRRGAARRARCRDRRRGIAGARAGMRGAWLGASKATSSVTVAPAPSRSMVIGPAAMSPSARPLRLASRASFSAPSAIRSRLLPKRSRAGGVGLDQFAVGGEDRRRPFEIGQQPARAFGQARSLPARSVDTTRMAGAVVGERDARAQADERAAEAGAETAQPFEPRRAALRQRAGQAHDLRGARMLRIELQRRERAGRGGIEDRGGDRIGPQDARGVRAP